MIHISEMRQEDWPAVYDIYVQGIQTSQATFESEPPASWEEWNAGKVSECSLVARVDGQVGGWAALSPFSKRDCYAGVAEVSLYVDPARRGQGLGDALLKALIDRSEAKGIWTLQARILSENQASVHLHAKHGFRQVGVRERLGKMSYGPYRGQWRDVVLVERRSKVVGV